MMIDISYHIFIILTIQYSDHIIYLSYLFCNW